MIITNNPGKERSFWKVLLLSIITLGIYILYWLYRNLTEMEQAFEFEKHETQITKAKRFYGAGFFLVFIYAISLANIIMYNPNVEGLRLVFIYSYYFNAAFAAIGMFFFYFFIKSVFLSQSKLKLTPFNKKAVYSLFIFRFALDLVIAAVFFSFNLEEFVKGFMANEGNATVEFLLENTNIKIFTLLSLLNNAGNIVLAIFVYRLQLEINCLWTCYKNSACIE